MKYSTLLIPHIDAPLAPTERDITSTAKQALNILGEGKQSDVDITLEWDQDNRKGVEAQA